MARIFVLGSSPLPWENAPSRPATGLRTAQFLAAAAAAGHEISLFCLDARANPPDFSPDFWPVGTAVFPAKTPPVRAARIFDRAPGAVRAARDFFTAGPRPDAIVAVNNLPASLAARALPRGIPLWADLNGWFLAEGQIKAAALGGDDFLPDAIRTERAVARRADFFSTATRRQKFALFGEMALLGRLTGARVGLDPVVAIPNATEFFPGENLPKPLEIPGLPADGALFYRLGAWNAWEDPAGTFAAVEAAMAGDPRIFFASTGGDLAGVSGGAGADFWARVRGSKFSARFFDLGWLPTAEIPRLHARGAGILSVEKKCAETTFGARNRLTEALKFGVPVVAATDAEIADDARSIRAFPAGADPAAVAEELLKIAKNPGAREIFAEQSRRDWAEKFRFENFAGREIFQKWLANPQKMTGSDAPVLPGRFAEIFGAAKFFRDRGLAATARKIFERVRG